jgi:hypothetical protein
VRLIIPEKALSIYHLLNEAHGGIVLRELWLCDHSGATVQYNCCE